MESTNLLYVFPYVISFLISLSVAVYAWQRRSVPGARPFALSAASQALWTLGYIFELTSETLAAKIFWDDMQFVGTLMWPTAFLAFALAYVGRSFKRPYRTWLLIFSPFLLFLALLATDRYHGLIRPSATLIPGQPFDALTYEFTTTVLLAAGYAYLLVFYGIYLLLNTFARAQSIYRRQMLAVVVGTFIPMVGILLTLVGVTLTFQRDTTPITFAISNLLIAWGLFRYRLFDIVPVARDAVFDGMSDYVLVLDANNRLVDINPAAQRVLKTPVSQLIGLPASLVLAAWGNITSEFGGETSVHTEIKISQDEQVQYLALRITPLSNGRHQNDGRIIVARDITDRKQAEQALKERSQQLQAANEELRFLSQVKDEFVANVSHELRTPLANIKLYHDLLTRYPHRQEEYLVVLERETDRLGKLIEDLLLLSRLDRKAIHLNFETVDLNTLVETMVYDRRALIESRGLQLKIRLLPAMPPVQADMTLLSQALSVLLTNATNYTSAGGNIEVYTEVDQSNGRIWAGFCVQDTGPGILLTEQDKLFSRFYRGEAAHSTQAAGTGLGLSIAKEIVDQHHGRITIESTGMPGQGAGFHVWLPTLNEEV